MPPVDERDFLHPDTRAEKSQQDSPGGRGSGVTHAEGTETPAPSIDRDEKRDRGTVKGSLKQGGVTWRRSDKTQPKKKDQKALLGESEANTRGTRAPRGNLTQGTTLRKHTDQAQPKKKRKPKRAPQPMSARETKPLQGILKPEATLSRGPRKTVVFCLSNLTSLVKERELYGDKEYHAYGTRLSALLPSLCPHDETGFADGAEDTNTHYSCRGGKGKGNGMRKGRKKGRKGEKVKGERRAMGKVKGEGKEAES